MNKKRVAIIIYGGIGGGIAQEGVICLVNLCEKIAQEYDLTVFSLMSVDKSYQPRGYQLIGVPVDDRKGMFYRMAYISLKLMQLHLQKRYVLIQAFWGYHAGLLALLFGKLFKLKTVVTFMGGEVANIPSIGYGLFQSVAKKKQIQFIAKNVDTIIALTQHHAQKLKESLQYKRLNVISFGVDSTIFHSSDTILSAPYQFVYLGNINKVKDLPSLIQTFRIISQHVDARLDIVGLDTLNGEIQVLVEQLQMSDIVSFHGYQLNKKLSSFLKRAHILLHTSLWESQAVVVNEAISAGVVVCGTRVGIIADLEGEMTIAASIGDSEQLAQKVIDLLNNSEYFKQLREKGIAWSRHHSLDIQSNKYIDLYQELLLETKQN